jgi:hypothetical protein
MFRHKIGEDASQSTGPGPVQFLVKTSAYRLPLTGGAPKRDDKLSKAIYGLPWPHFLPSPDGSRLVEGDRLIDVRSGAVRQLPKDLIGSMAWSSDSRALLSFLPERKSRLASKAVLFPVDRPSMTKILRVDPPISFSQLKAPMLWQADGKLTMAECFQDFRSRDTWGKLVVRTQICHVGSDVVRSEPAREFYPSLSPNAMIYGPAMGIGKMGRLMCPIRTDDIGKSTWSLMTVELDGSGMRFLGSEPIPLAGRQPDSYHEERFGAEWAPDGKRLYFVANDKLYRIEDR